MFKQISAMANVISLITLGYVFSRSLGTECFKLEEWYLTITPLFLAVLAEFIARFIIQEEA